MPWSIYGVNDECGFGYWFVMYFESTNSAAAVHVTYGVKNRVE